jgi:glutathionylspermidine synthase
MAEVRNHDAGGISQVKRRTVNTRSGWQEKFDEFGFSFHSMDGLYWNEGVCYEFAGEDIDRLEKVTAALHEMCIEAVDHVVEKNLFPKMGIPDTVGEFISRSWQRDDRSLYGRFDLSYDGLTEPKLLEYNADTPTSLFESSIAQWIWIEEMFPRDDQFNSIHEKLLDAFSQIRGDLPLSMPVYFSCVKDHEEDFVTTEYMRDVATQAGLDARHIFIEDIGYRDDTEAFCDLDNDEISFMFKLYPWEWVIADEFGRHVLKEKVRMYEPPWKMVLSNKAVLPILWEMFEGHPNLLPSYFEPDKCGSSYVKKPLFSREGSNISYFEDGHCVEDTEGSYGAEGFIYQKAQRLPCFDGNYAVVGSWVINGLPAGIGIREDASPVTKNTSTFVPHYFIN